MLDRVNCLDEFSTIKRIFVNLLFFGLHRYILLAEEYFNEYQINGISNGFMLQCCICKVNGKIFLHWFSS
jgi:hypothetical protein